MTIIHIAVEHLLIRKKRFVDLEINAKMLDFNCPGFVRRLLVLGEGKGRNAHKIKI